MSARFCASCGAALVPSDARFCSSCGVDQRLFGVSAQPADRAGEEERPVREQAATVIDPLAPGATPPAPSAPPRSSPPPPGPPPPPSPPVHPPGAPPPAHAPSSGAYAPIAGRARAARAMLLITMVMAAVGALSDGFAVELLGRIAADGSFTNSETSATNTRRLVVGFTLTGVGVATAVVFLRWFFPAYRNVARLGAGELRFKPGWAIGAWFIPFYNLIGPKLIADDLWRASDPDLPPEAGGRWRGQPVPAVFAWWWSLWVVTIFVDGVSTQVVVRAESPTVLLIGLVISLVGYLLRIVAGVLVLRVIGVTTKRQEARAAKLGVSPGGAG